MFFEDLYDWQASPAGSVACMKDFLISLRTTDWCLQLLQFF